MRASAADRWSRAKARAWGRASAPVWVPGQGQERAPVQARAPERGLGPVRAQVLELVRELVPAPEPAPEPEQVLAWARRPPAERNLRHRHLRSR
jgi:hypothetical protein